MKILRLAVCFGGLSLSACSLFRATPPPPPPVVEAPPPPAPQLPKPVATHRSEVEPGNDIVGYVQKTIVGKEDTLPDIARRFDVGYEEILTANRESIRGCPVWGVRWSCPPNSCCRRLPVRESW